MNTFDSLAQQLLSKLKSNGKIPTIYSQLELLGPLLEEKYGGRLGSPRLLFRRDDDWHVLHSRMPNDFHGGEHASWDKLTRRESTELRNYLIELLSQWLDTDSENPESPPAKLSFRAECERIRAKLDSGNQDDLVRFFRRRWQLFEAAFGLVFDDACKNAVVQLACLLQLPALKEDDHLWPKWPSTEEFITFASYRQTANSVLGLGIRFVASVHGAVQVAKLEALKSFDVSDADEAEVISWYQEARRLAREETLGVNQWAMSEVFRDREIMEVRVQRELEQALPKGADNGGLVKQIYLCHWDKQLLLAMLDLGAFASHYRNSSDICDRAQHPSGHKSCFDGLKRMGLVTTPPNRKGRMLTEAGLRTAKGLTEQQ